jgi:hypothetical protein
MGFVAWHQLRWVVPPLFLLAMIRVTPYRNPLLDQIAAGALALLLLLGLWGALLALLLLFTPFRWKCPRCGSRKTEFGVSKEEGGWLDCDSCGVLRETGFLKLFLRWELREPEKDPP